LVSAWIQTQRMEARTLFRCFIRVMTIFEVLPCVIVNFHLSTEPSQSLTLGPFSSQDSIPPTGSITTFPPSRFNDTTQHDTRPCLNHDITTTNSHLNTPTSFHHGSIHTDFYTVILGGGLACSSLAVELWFQAF
jgi:hypothetical protein